MRGWRLAFAALVVPTLALGSMHGCGSDEPPIENLCGWLGDPHNCYRAFFQDVDARCGVLGKGNAPKGGFDARDVLESCVLNAPIGGSVSFNPKLDPSTFPPKSVTFTMVGSDGLPCGGGSWGGTYTFSATVNAYPPGDAAAGDAGPTGEVVTGGTFSSTSPDGREIFDVSCPGGTETHHFDLLQTSKCPQYANVLPRAEIESSPGAVNVPGFIRFRVYYPPAEGALENAQPVVVEYFDCSFPGPPEPCADQVQNGTETDVDCGGGLCATRCAENQGCKDNTDCASGNCAINKMGLKKCAAGSGTGGAGGGAGGAGGGVGGSGG